MYPIRDGILFFVYGDIELTVTRSTPAFNMPIGMLPTRMAISSADGFKECIFGGDSAATDFPSPAIHFPIGMKATGMFVTRGYGDPIHIRLTIGLRWHI